MQLKLFDIFSAIIPGALVLCALIFTNMFHSINLDWIEKKVSTFKDISAIITMIFIVLSYLTGYIVHAFGSWVEPFLWKTWGGRPSLILFTQNSSRIGLGGDKESLLSWLKSQSNDPSILNIKDSHLKPDDFRRLFQVAKNLAFTKGSSSHKLRIEEFNNSYIFSRNILVSFLIVLGCLLTLILYKLIPVKWLIGHFTVVLIVWWRARDRALYYSREILVAGYYSSREVNDSQKLG